MKQLLLFAFLISTLTASSQSVIQSVNSASIIGASGSISVGEIVVVPVNQTQSSSGIIALLAQINQTLEVPQLELSETITVFPNPTTSTVFFKTSTNLIGEKISVFDLLGKLISQKQITGDNALDLSELSSGVYLIQFTNKNIKSFKIIKR